jgi:hypothetical protein
MVVVMAYFSELAIPRLARRFPALSQAVAAHPLTKRLASRLARLQQVSA